MSNYCDLHTHSNFSDGKSTPTELINEAKKIGLQAIALTDHNTIKGLDEFISAAKDTDILAIPGIEISTEHKGYEIHIVGLFIKPDKYDEVTNFVQRNQDYKHESNLTLIANLNKAGYNFSLDDVIDYIKSDNINRASIGDYLCHMGYVSSIQDAFSTLLNEKNGYYIPGKKIPSTEAIEFLNSIGAVSVWAHPFISIKDENEVLNYAMDFKNHGLMAMEEMYSKFTDEQTKYVSALNLKLGLLNSGGSDFHGSNKPDIHLGIGRGNLKIPVEYAYELQKYSK